MRVPARETTEESDPVLAHLAFGKELLFSKFYTSKF